MGNLIGTVVRGPYVDRIDGCWKPGNSVPVDIEAKLQDLDYSLLQMGKDTDVCSDTLKKHIEEEFFGASWWPGHEHREEIIRAAYIEAIDQAKKKDEHGDIIGYMPIVTYWVRNTDHFEAVVTNTTREVHVFWLTPAPPMAGPPAKPEKIEEKIVHIATKERIEDLRSKFPDGYKLDKVKEYIKSPNGKHEVLGQRMLGYAESKESVVKNSSTGK